MIKKIGIVIFAAAVILLTASCNGTEPNDLSYIVALGIDSGENGKYNITIQYANPAQISNGEEINLEDSGVKNVTVEASDIYEAVATADLHESKKLFLSHTKVVIFSESVAMAGLEEMSEMFINSEELRPDVYLAVSENAQEYLEGLNPETEANPAKYYKMFFDKDKLTGLPHGTLKIFFDGIETGEYDTVLPIVTNENEDPQSAVFRGGRMVGTLDREETEIYKFLDRDFADGFVTLENDDTLKKPVTIKISQKKAPRYKIDRDNLTVHVDLILTGGIYSAPPDYDEDVSSDEFRKKCEEHIKKDSEELIKRVITEYRSDIFHFDEYAKRNFWTYDEYERFKKFTDYSSYDISVSVEFDIKKTGMMQKEN